MLDPSFILKFLKFGAVGISGMAVDFGITSFLKEILKVRKYIANSIGFTLAASSNFILNRVWTFNSSDPQVMIQYSKFILIALIGLFINNLTIYLFTDRLLRLNFYISKGIATLVVFFWNFSMNYLFTF